MLCRRNSFPSQRSALLPMPPASFFKAYRSGLLLGSVFSLLFLVAPVLIERRYPTIPAATSLVAALRWVGDKAMLGLTAMLSFMWVLVVCMLIGDARTFVGRVMSARAAPPTGPIALEEGSAPTTADTTSDTTSAAPTAPAPKPTLTPTQKLTSLLSSTFFLASQILSSDLHRPLLDTAAAALTYVLRGCEVLFALFLVLVVVRVRGVTRSAAPAPVEVPVEVLVEVDVLVVGDGEKKGLVGES
ncbi:hypothetical protein B0H12DRAFT_165111 [Mycena haematopus]|nr:hypothetical protein B0H12DRAFT_165111 [Mycena haematopus]